jgi:hypothetical protein
VRARPGRAAHRAVRRGTSIRRGVAVIAVAAAGGAGLAGCGGRPGPAAARPAGPGSLPLAISGPDGAMTWAVIPMGSAAPGPGQVWELVTLAGGSRWTVATPPAVTTSGAIAVTAGRGGSLLAAIRPRQALRFSPVTGTADGGRTWVPGNPAPGLAAVPDALAAAPDGRELIALAGDPAIAVQSRWPASGGGLVPAGQWTALAGRTSLAAAPAGRACGVTALTAAAFSPAGRPVLGADCRRPGVAGILAGPPGGWQLAGPPLPAGLRGRRIRVLRLTLAAGRLTALLQAGAGPAAVLVAAWTADGRAWTVSAPLPLRGAAVSSTSFGGDGTAAVELGGRRAMLVPGPVAARPPAGPAPAGRAWRRLPALPAAPHVTLAVPGGAAVMALATDGGVLTVWQLSRGGGGWIRVQRVVVPVPDG